MKKLVILLLTAALSTASLFALDANFLKAAYVQPTATASFAAIKDDVYKKLDIVLLAFADTTSTAMNSDFSSAIKTVISKNPNAIYLLSLGGETAKSSNFTQANVQTIISNINSQITSFNSQMSSGKISGVDLDLENAIEETVISELASGFKKLGYTVSVAPQVYTSGGDITSSTKNLVLTSGWNSTTQSCPDTYMSAIKSGNVDYIMAQTYNSSEFKVGGYSENEVGFFEAVSVALNNNINIPSTTKILIGEVANQTAGGYTIFNPKGTDVYSSPYAYDQDNILEQLNTSLSTMKNNSTNFGNIKGVMLWSLNNDYSPSSWNDPSATAGAFCSKIFGAATPSPTSNVYFIIQVSNTGNYKNASVTLAVNSQYYIFGYGSSNVTIPATSGNNYQCWGTLASSKDVSGVLDSSNLDAIFSNGATSFTSTVIGNAYNNWETSINNPDKQTSGTSYTFEAGKSYNVMFNPDSMALEISQVSSKSK